MKLHKSVHKYNNKKTKYSRVNKKGGANSSENCVYDFKDSKMKGRCPGYQHFNSIKESIVKDTNAVYMIMGHGCDLNNELKRVPTKCKYITSVACGIARDINPQHDINIDFVNNKIKTPITADSLSTYERINLHIDSDPITNKMYTRNEEFRIHNEGDYYVNSKNSCFTAFGFLGGLRKLGHIVPDIPFLNSKLPQNYTLRSYILMHFEGSLFPTCEQVNKCLDINFSKSELDNYNYNSFEYEFQIDGLMKTNFSIDYATIMDYLEGTFINSACRPICKGPFTQQDIEGLNDDFVPVSRSMSGREVYTVNPDFIDQFPMNEYSDRSLTADVKSKLEQHSISNKE